MKLAYPTHFLIATVVLDCAASGATNQPGAVDAGAMEDVRRASNDSADSTSVDPQDASLAGDVAGRPPDVARAPADGQKATGADGTPGTTSVVYALNPPRQCDNQFFVSGCQSGVSNSTCGGICQSANACENLSGKAAADVGFLCPRFMLFGDEMTQAAKDDSGSVDPPYRYAIVGHDVDTGGLDGTASSTCCQCYQLVFDLPENDAQINGSGPSAVAIPKPLVVQTFNTSAGGGHNFDLFMGAGGFGSYNACDPTFASMPSPSGRTMYTQFPKDGEPGSGGEKAALMAECKTTNNLVTSSTLSSAACQSKMHSGCSSVASGSPSVTNETVQSCILSNDPMSYYHINWHVYAKKIECPTHLTEVTGCKLAPQGLTAVDPNVTTGPQAGADSTFKPGYTTTTMQDCCKPSCAWQDWVSAKGLTPIGHYDSFYSCDQNGVPVTE